LTVQKVIDNDYCIGCSACKLVGKEDVSISFKSNGFYSANIKNNQNANIASQMNAVCPFSSESLDENQLGEHLYSDQSHDERIGYYRNTYAGHISDKTKRLNSSSGGLTTWFATKLIENKVVDAVVHVGVSGNEMFEYKISRTTEELLETNNKKSRYYPVTYSDVIKEMITTGESFLFIGTPCFVKSIRLLQKESILKNKIITAALLCGHMKSKYFAESLAWQSGVEPWNLDYIDFRIKNENFKANEYFIEAKHKDGSSITEKNSSLLASNWGYGFFKNKACDFCDDIGGETADVTFGDAWLPRYTKDYLGTNIVISRSPIFDEYIQKYNEEIFIENVSVDDFYQTQAGNFRHRRDGLNVRLKEISGWKPKKRHFKLNGSPSSIRNKLYLFRYKLSRHSESAFQIALKYKSIRLFEFLMFPYVIYYEFINRSKIGFLKFIVKKIIPKKKFRDKKD
jgi:coenzyme F420 hydrogenase subunit beta